jgi:hypothetical protein
MFPDFIIKVYDWEKVLISLTLKLGGICVVLPLLTPPF